ncbi:monovalent cation:proton antiporter-2 (CPA2) family protein [Phenylobacterium sp.]|uniref:monovalent cation:proton antiporter-2 (CPA2) family protein n=1 Tax=Phenylobacterium sp. TaxID=1871053 RepID=UPI002E311A39|nr:monovalent cation:proton antiporter-2 (CPA2) family protein [Phenylobacterium sp.]HEX4709565.1 monovalent cation:proton antiporter-2 (CPA2) family protein [Phenylobacterium sp.]
MNAQPLLVQVLVYLAAGVISVPIAKRLGQGSVLGYLVAGVLIGPFLLNLVGAPEQVRGFAQFGVVILLFLIGLEVRPALLWKMRTTIFGLGAAQMLVTAALVAGAAVALGLDWRTATAVGLILSLSSTAIVLQSLEEKGLRQGPMGEAAFGVLLFQDLAVIPLFALLPLLAPAGVAPAVPNQAASLFAPLPGWAQALAQMAAIALVVAGGRYMTRPMFRFIAAARLREIFTASALLLVVLVAALMEVVGLSPALGAFLAGVVLAESEFRRELETDIEPFRGLLLGLFFITVGAGVDLRLVAAQPLIVAGLVAGLMVLKMIAMYGAARLFRTPHRVALGTAVALAQGGEFAFVLLDFVLGAKVLGPELAHLLTAVVAVSMAATPLVFAAYERLVLSREEERAEPEVLPFDESAPDVVVAGFGRFGQIATRLLLGNNFSVVLLDSSIEQIEIIRRFGWAVHYGDASRIDLLRTAGAEKAKLLVVAIDDRDKVSEMVEAARQAFPRLAILARAWDRRHAYELLKTPNVTVERETFESALNMGRKALLKLGLSERRASRAAALFREQDDKFFRELAPVAGEEENYIMAARDASETTERLLRAEMQRIAEEEDLEDAPQLAPARRLEPDKERVRKSA